MRYLEDEEVITSKCPFYFTPIFVDILLLASLWSLSSSLEALLVTYNAKDIGF
jgi:hypothetical protein